MIPRSRRIPKDLFNIKGVLYHSPLFTLKVSRNAEPKPTLVSTSVSKKVAPHAVDRNRTRRRVYSILRPFLPTLPLGFLLFFQAKKGAERASFDEIKTGIQGLLSQIRP